MSTPAKRPAYLIRVGMAHRRLAISIAIGIVIMFLIPASLTTRMLVGWDVGVLIYLVAAAVVMSQCSSTAQMRANAAAQDEGALAILILSVIATFASVGAIFAELAQVEGSDPNYGFYITLAIGTVLLSWTFIHMIFALHYAHDFYGTGVRKNGLRFPEDEHPDYWDFVYFSFVIGMTFQVSDVAVTHKLVRRTVVAHGALSFLFSTSIVAMTVNIVANVMQK